MYQLEIRHFICRGTFIHKRAIDGPAYTIHQWSLVCKVPYIQRGELMRYDERLCRTVHNTEHFLYNCQHRPAELNCDHSTKSWIPKKDVHVLLYVYIYICMQVYFSIHLGVPTCTCVLCNICITLSTQQNWGHEQEHLNVWKQLSPKNPLLLLQVANVS